MRAALLRAQQTWPVFGSSLGDHELVTPSSKPASKRASTPSVFAFEGGVKDRENMPNSLSVASLLLLLLPLASHLSADGEDAVVDLQLDAVAWLSSICGRCNLAMDHRRGRFDRP